MSAHSTSKQFFCYYQEPQSGTETVSARHFYYWGWPHDMGQFFLFVEQNCAIACGTRAYVTARICADVAQGKWPPKFPKSFMLLGHNSRPLWQLEFCFSIFAVSCSNLSEESANLGMSRFLSLTKLSSAALFTTTSNYSNLNFTYEEDYNSFSTTQKKKNKTSWICLDISAFRPNN